MVEAVQSLAEQRVILRNVDWETHERLLEGRGESRVPRFAFDRGMLEIMSPSAEHESITYYVGLLAAMFARETGIGIYGVGSATLLRSDLEQSVEPDCCFYTRGRERVRGKRRIDLDADPSPDLVVEVDITHPSLDRLPIYAGLGVSEVWRYIGEDGRFETLSLREASGDYEVVRSSVILPSLTGEELGTLVEQSAALEIGEWLDKVSEIAGKHIGS